MRIGLISTVDGPVCQTGTGSIQALVWLLSRELQRLRHEVTVFGVAGSEPCGELVATLPGVHGVAGAPHEWELCEWINLCRAVEQSARFDVLHSHGYLWGLPLEPFVRAPMVHTLHVWPSRDEAFLWSTAPAACVTAISHCQWSKYPDLKPAATIHHGVDASQFTFRREPEDYVCFLGQFAWGKGPSVAIQTARALGVRLLLAGPVNDYYREHIQSLVDGRSVEYVGFVSGAERDRLLGGARALLYPIQSKEPFGLVQVEAMMCGTPVAAINLGAVPEIINEGVTGSCAPSADELPQAVLRALMLDRQGVRAEAAARFSAERMAQEYARVYDDVIARRDASATR
jgi:glycosyltransferase involved in cell wall biosynthesis